MKGILIDPYAGTVTEVEYSGDFKDIYTLIDCNTFDAFYIDNNDSVFVDDEGLLDMNDNTRFFYYEGAHQPMAGKGLVLGQNDDGDSVDAVTPVEVVRQKVRFMSALESLSFARRHGM